MFMSIPFVYGDKCPCRNKDLTNTARIKKVANMIKRRVSFSSTSTCDDKDCKMNHHDSHHHNHHHHCSASDDAHYNHIHTHTVVCQDHIQSEENINNGENTENDTSCLTSIKCLASKEEQYSN